ncbi:inositol 5-phosphatase-like protein [Aaosphaeria arxii CBS 175.79]|uniref:Inositol 5-phosphatase-like protein n=1 Tax=Aaosphaeria arxii CBS 175.79 TaxID=1450172 RepID=A0A6A5XN51_9PLEO|nr:inositol 5-phosphatase-like protein [Aaosphaeria arxii CBS 175.79]KAF2014668.1 inositol 5-phosphatase-like protein [Aaosphaeria arxii CBS 175.79]
MFELYLVTFNCARNLVDPESLGPSLFNALPPTAASLPDVLAISLQEVSPIAYSFLGGSFLSPYFDHVTQAVNLASEIRSHGHERLEHVATRSLGMTALMIYAKPHMAQRIQWLQSAGAGVGFWNMGNKGAVALRLGLSCPGSDDLLKLTFTAAHLAPMECNIEARNRDWSSIVQNLVFENNESSGYSSSEQVPLLSSSSDPPEDNNGLFTSGNHVFFAGDLNYRTHDKPPGPDAWKSYPQPTSSRDSDEHFSHLLGKDQLAQERDSNRTLHGLDELPITFPPTYKLSSHSSEQLATHKRSNSEEEGYWNWSKHRYPSWCDRILYSRSRALKPQTYTALPIQHTSDHRPVALYARVDDKPLQGPDDIRSSTPFSINPHWKSRRDTARKLEIIVGSLSYVVLTPQGNAIVVTLATLALAGWWLAVSLSR